MSNRFEIQQELTDAQRDLQVLCQKEAKQCKKQTGGVITIEPQYGKQMNDLRDKCGQLSMILEAMDASED